MKKRRWTYFLPVLIFPARLWLNVQIAKYHYGKLSSPPAGPHHFGKSRQRLQLMIVGDSLGVGLGGTLQDSIGWRIATKLSRHHSVTLSNRAISGATAVTVRRQQLSRSGPQPDVILLSVGTNDVLRVIKRRMRPRQAIVDLDALLTDMRNLWPQAIIMVCGSADIASLPIFGRLMSRLADVEVKRYNRQTERLCEEHGAIFVPLAHLVAEEFRTNPACFATDRFHPSGYGYQVLSEALLPYLEAALKERERIKFAPSTH